MSDTVRAEIEAQNARFTSLFNAGDVRQLSMLYTEDAQLLAPGYDAFSGREAIAAAMGGLRGDGNRVRIDTAEVEAAGDSAWEVGTYTVSLPDGGVADRGKYIVIWKREDGTWRLHRDIINTSQPAQG